VPELITAPNLGRVTCLHHCAAIVGSCLCLGAIPWLGPNDLKLFSSTAIMLSYFHSSNFCFLFAMVGYHTSAELRVQFRFLQYARNYCVFVWLLLRPAVTWTWVFLKAHQYQSVAPLVVYFGVDVATSCDSVYIVCNLMGMCRRCQGKLAARKATAHQKDTFEASAEAEDGMVNFTMTPTTDSGCTEAPPSPSVRPPLGR